MFTLRSPIPKTFFGYSYRIKQDVCKFNQLFGENGNDFYRQLGLLGHNGIDFTTKFYWRRLWNWTKWDSGDVYRAEGKEALGVIPVLAAHDGYLTIGKNEDRTRGVYMKIMSDEVTIDGRLCKVETMYFHLDRVVRYFGDGHAFGNKPANFIKAGSILGYSDNTGEYTTGAHLHFGMYIYWKRQDGSYTRDRANGYDGAVNPLPFLQDDVIYQRNNLIGVPDSYKNGKQL